jgi:hypothetical protein
MSYMLYLNGQLVQLSDSKPIAQTKQVNDIARLDNRQTNYTNKFIAPLVANNLRIMENVYLVGNQSNIPYSKIVADLYDSESGECLIYKGWANVSSAKDAGYEICVYDGIIDFYRLIENKTLTDIDITPLNHLKNVTSVIRSFANDLPYKYIIGDYNGKNSDVVGPGLTVLLDVNIDYQVPSARNEWLWKRVFEFIGWTFSGPVFETEDFKNFFMTFPKPVPQLVPKTTVVTTQSNSVVIDTMFNQDGSSAEYTNTYTAILIPNAFSNSFGSHVLGTFYTTINVTGSYLLKAEGSFCGNAGECSSEVIFTLSNGSSIIQTGSFNTLDNPTITIAVSAGNRLLLRTPIVGRTSSYGSWPLTGSMTTSIEHVDGFDANFSEALVDFKITDYVNEVMQRFCLTGFKDKYENHIEFLQLEEIITNEPEDWSKMFSKKRGEKYTYGNYAKRNLFKYRYNNQNEKHHDGYIEVVNENLKDEIPVINSKIYAPDLGSKFMGQFTGVFRMWNKELKEGGIILYKELFGRYYFLRSKEYTQTIIIGSKALNTYETIESFPTTNYDRMPFWQVIEDNYSFMQTLLNKAKTLDVDFHLSSKKVATFDFKRMVFVEQLGSYYLINKIKGFIKDKVTTCEIIEVDRDQTSLIEVPPPIYILELLNYTIVSCQMIFDVITNIDQPAFVTVDFYAPNVVFGPGTGNIVSGTLDNNQITVPLSQVLSSGGFNYEVRAYHFSATWVQTTSNMLLIPVPSGCYVGAGNLTELSYTRNPGEDMIVTITTDIPFPFTISLQGSKVFPDFGFFMPITVVATSNVIHFPGVPAGVWNFNLISGSVTSNYFS